MGYIRNECIVINGWDADRVRAAHKRAQEILAGYSEELSGATFQCLVTPVVEHVANGGASFFIAPDGSKEGWLVSDDGDAARAEFIDWVKTQKYVDWALVLIGGDDDEFRVLESSHWSDDDS